MAPTSAYQPSLLSLKVSTRPPMRLLASTMVTFVVHKGFLLEYVFQALKNKTHLKLPIILFLHRVSGVFKELGGGQTGDAPSNDGDVARRLGGGKAFDHKVQELAVVGVLKAVVQGVCKDTAHGEHHQPDQNQRD